MDDYNQVYYQNQIMTSITRNFSTFEESSEAFASGAPKDGKGKKILPVSLGTEFQTPRLCFVEDVDLSDTSVRNSYLKVVSDRKGEAFKSWMASFDDWVVQQLEAVSVDIWGKTVSDEAIRELYKPSISPKNNMKLYWPRCKTGDIKVRVVGKDNAEIDVPEVMAQGSRIVSIVRCRQINVYKSQAWPQWEVRTFTVKAAKIVQQPQCIIDESDSDSESESEYCDDM